MICGSGPARRIWHQTEGQCRENNKCEMVCSSRVGDLGSAAAIAPGAWHQTEGQCREINKCKMVCSSCVGDLCFVAAWGGANGEVCSAD